MLSLRQSQQLILEKTPVLGSESTPILDALGRVLNEEIIAVEDLPAADISAVDGYAGRHASFTGASKDNPVRLQIIGESSAGKPCGKAVGRDEAVRIMTGGLIPEGADAVVEVERTTESCGVVLCHKPPERGDGIRFQGDSLKKGDVVLRAGKVIRPLEVGALASLRRAYVDVRRRPLVAIIATGNELSDFHEPAAPDKTMCSNLYALAAQVRAINAVPLIMGIVPDDLETLSSVICEARHADVIITSGGTSRGKFDLVHKAFSSLGLTLHFSNMFAKPGKSTIFGTIGDNLVFGLPGNPTSTMLSFEQFVRPALMKMMGQPDNFDSPYAPSFARFDSFNREFGGNKTHLKPSQVPIENIGSQDVAADICQLPNRRRVPDTSATTPRQTYPRTSPIGDSDKVIKPQYGGIQR